MRGRFQLALSAAFVLAAVLGMTALGSAAATTGGSVIVPREASHSPARAAAPTVTKLLAETSWSGVSGGFSLRDVNGVSVANLAPGTYEIEVTDSSNEMSFHLVGPGVDKATGVEEIVTTTWTVTLTNGEYRFYCDAAPRTFHGSFTVGAPPPPPPPPPAPARSCVVPHVEGTTLPSARTKLAAAHCRLGKVTSSYSGVKSGRVVSQSPPAGTQLAHLANVDVVLSRGRKR